MVSPLQNSTSRIDGDSDISSGGEFEEVWQVMSLLFLVEKLSQEIQLDHQVDMNREHRERQVGPQPALADRGQKVDDKNQYRLHSRED